MCSLPLSLSLSQRVVVDANWRYHGVGLHSHTHSLSLSLCLSATLPFSLSFKRCCDTANGINRNTDFSLSSPYHFKGYTYTKVLVLSNRINDPVLWKPPSFGRKCFGGKCFGAKSFGGKYVGKKSFGAIFVHLSLLGCVSTKNVRSRSNPFDIYFLLHSWYWTSLINLTLKYEKHFLFRPTCFRWYNTR